VSNKHNLENSGAKCPTNSPAIPLDAELVVRREAPGGLAELDGSVKFYYKWTDWETDTLLFSIGSYSLIP
jgi:hypothetical protein